MCAHCAWSLRNYSSTATLLICVAGFSELAVFQSPRSKLLGLPAEEFRFPIPTQVRNSKCRSAFSTLLMAHGTNMPNAKVINVLLMCPFPYESPFLSSGLVSGRRSSRLFPDLREPRLSGPRNDRDQRRPGKSRGEFGANWAGALLDCRWPPALCRPKRSAQRKLRLRNPLGSGQ